MTIKFYINKENLEVAKNKAAERNCELLVESSRKVYPLKIVEYRGETAILEEDFSKETIGEVFFVSINPTQDAAKYKLIAACRENELIDFGSYWNEKNSQVDYQRCDRCGVKHERKNVYILCEQSTQKIIQVGGGCAIELDCELALKKLLQTEKKFYDELKELFPDQHGERGQGNSSDYRNLKNVAAITIGYIRKNGYLSKAACELDGNSTPTSEIIDSILYNANDEWDNEIKEFLTEYDGEEILNKTIEFLKNKLEKKWDTLSYNALNVLSYRAPYKSSLVTWAFYAVEAEKIKEENEKKLLNSGQNADNYNEGERYEFQLEILNLKPTDGVYGFFVGITAVDNGLGKVWLKKGQKWDELKIGDKFSIVAGVKSKKEGITFLGRPSKFEKL